MKLYVACHFYEWELVRRWEDILEDAGHEITYSWAKNDGGRTIKEHELTNDVLRAAGERDLDGIRRCDLFLWLAHEPKMLGAPFEAGYAHALDKLIIVVDPYRKCPFFLLSGVWVMTKDEALGYLTTARA